MTEIWKAVVGFEGFYEVSSLGRVRSLDRLTTQKTKGGAYQTRRFKGKILSPALNRKRYNYRYVGLIVQGQQTLRRVAVLVAAAFIGPRPCGSVTCHVNGVSTDDRAENLRYDTPKNNTADMAVHGTKLMGETSPNARLTEAQVRLIKSSTAPADTLAARYGVHPGHINNIRRGERWAHVK